MGLLTGLLGIADEINPSDLEDEFSQVLTTNEQIQYAFKVIRDKIVFTDKRLILLDIQGVTGSKKEYHSIPYKSIYHFSVETAGSFDLETELKIFVGGTTGPIVKLLGRGVDVVGIQQKLAHYICK